MKKINLFFQYNKSLFVAICLLFIHSLLFGNTDGPSNEKKPIADLMMDDGSLNLMDGFSGSLDLTGYSVEMDDCMGPTFTAMPPPETWSALGTGLNGTCYAIVLDGNGNLYVGGDFTAAGGITVNGVAKWDGNTWSALGTGLKDHFLNGGSCYALAMDSEGNLYAGGEFSTAGEIAANNIAKWNGTSWSAFSTGLNNLCLALAVDSEDNLYAGGAFGMAGGVTVGSIAKWDGSTWSDLDYGFHNDCYVIKIADNGDLYAAGAFEFAGNLNVAAANHIAKWDGSTWSALGTGLNSNCTDFLLDGSGNIYAIDTGNDIAMWDGSSWNSLGVTIDLPIYAIAMDGSGNLYAGGYFAMINSVAANQVAMWDGSNWSALGTGTNGGVVELTTDGSGNLYAGGSFTTAGGINANRIAKWGEATCPDADEDGYTDIACGGDDCDDSNPNVHPNATEVCNGIDDNCDGEINEGCPPPIIRVEGNNHPIANGNMTPESYYHTDFSSACDRTHTFEITNFGYQAGDLELVGSPLVAISGSTDFTVTKQPGVTSLSYFNKTTFDITFSPTSPGLKTATVTIESNDPDNDPFIFAIHGTLFEGPIIYVNDDATGANDGTSWDDALTSLEFALYLARNCNVEVWVAEGTYHGLFNMPKNVHVLGGFPNTGNPGLADRDWDTFKTILSGDINGDDGPDFTNMEENWGDFIRTFDVGMDFLLEGFYIEGGNGSNGVWYNGTLAGSVPTIAHCTFQNNTGIWGGAAYGVAHQGNENKAIVKNCRFIHNRATFGGVAQLFSYEGEIDWTFTNCSFQNNKGVIGANFSFLSDNDAELTTKFTNCTFQNDDEPFLYNGNQTQVSKAIHLLQNGTSTNTSTIDNCIFWRGTGTGKTLSNNSATVNISHTLMEENGCPGANCGDGMIFNQDPLFKDAANGDVSLDDCSPAIDAGLDAANPLAYDIASNPRQFDAISGGMKIDMGAIENQTDQDSDDDGTPNCEDTEECDGLDNNGDGFVDEGLPTFDYYLDNDGDGYGAGAATTDCQSPGANYVTQNGDCNDNDPDIFPGNSEVCDGKDNDCANGIDDGLVVNDYYFDGDGDGYGAGAATSACSSPGNDYVLQNGDCDDSNPNVHPSATEVCNGIDDDCDGEIDEGTAGGLTYVGNIQFTTQAAVDAFSQCYSIINGHVIISGAGINDLSNLINLEEVTGNVTIQYTGLISLAGLENLTTIGGAMTVYFNTPLASLNGLEALNSIGASLYMYYNFQLSDCCAIYNLLNNGGVSGSVVIFYNKVGCNSVAEINNNCLPPPLIGGSMNLSTNGHSMEVTEVTLFPNPAKGAFKVVLPESFTEGRMTIQDLHGRVVMHQAIKEGQIVYQFENNGLSAGIYIVVVRAGGQPVQAKRLVVEQ